MMHRILFIDDDEDLRELVAQRLRKRGYDVTARPTAEAAKEELNNGTFDLVVTDVHLGQGTSGIELCEWVSANRPNVPVVVITAFGSMDLAVQAIRAGAYDFIPKPVEIEALVLSTTRAIQHRELREEVERLRQETEAPAHFEEILGESPEMQRVFHLVDRVARAEASVLLTGESGTGKELFARAIHQRSRRAEGPFLAISCAAMPETLLESELFGYQKGAFTDAKTSKTGLLAQANQGTFFLDELGELPLPLQPKLLRALEERRVRPVGGSQEVSFDTRFVAATNVDLEAAVEDGRFREDLYYRINVVHVRLPALRERGGDVLLLAQHFLDQYAKRAGSPVHGFSSAAAERLLGYAWPGNVRELRNCIERAVALAQHDKITVDDLPERIQRYRVKAVYIAADEPGELLPMKEVERRYIQRVLEAVNGSRTTAAKILGFDRKTLYRKLNRYGLDQGGDNDS